MRYLKFGRTTLPLWVPENWRTTDVQARKEESFLTLEDLFFSSVENPVKERPLSQWIKDFEKILIIVPDVTRYAGVDLILPLLFNKYLKGKDVQILFALGNHRKHKEDEKKEILGEEIYNKFPSYDHDCFSFSSLSFFGKTKSGVPVFINSLVRGAEGIIVIGSINFHYLAGFGGGRKIVIPGVAGYETIIGVHRKVFGEKGRHELSRPGVLDGNPMHEEIMSGLRLIDKPFFLINTVVDERKIIAIFSGDLKEAHMLGCLWYLNRYGVKIKKKADVIITSPGGHPADINFIQTHKAIEHAFPGIKKNGYLVVVGTCEDGIGNERFLDFFDYGSSEEMEKIARVSDKVYSQTAYATKLKAEYCNILLVSMLEESSVLRMGLIPKKDIGGAIEMVDDGSEKDCYVLYEGSKTLLIYEGGEDGV